MEKYKDKYRISSIRLKSWNYTWNGMYFITINTKNHEHYFGNGKEGKIILNPLGEIASRCWTEIPIHFKHIALGEFVIMPDHMHGIIIIDKPYTPNNPTTIIKSLDGFTDDALDGFTDDALHATSLHLEPQQHSSSVKPIIISNQFMSSISPKPNSISTIIRSYKSAVTKFVRPLNENFCWQERFYDRIIRNNDAFIRISQYIKNNPSKWNCRM